MLQTIYYIILIYFVLGAAGFYFINKSKLRSEARHSWTKYISYFVIINVLYLSIVKDPKVFRFVMIIILLAAGLELIRLFVKSEYHNKILFFLSIITLIICGIGLLSFSNQTKQTILFAFLILSIFDSFSQITGQIFGRRKILPAISPNKTLEGLIGGVIISFVSMFLLKDLYPESLPEVFVLTCGILVFSFLGDIAASYVKRKYGVKDYSNMIPGHGGFLDRFDSLIAGGAWVAFFQNFNL